MKPTISQGHEQALRMLKEHCPAGGTVVDAGAWPGSLSRQMKGMGWNVIALDKDAERQQKWQPTDLLSMSFIQATNENSPTFQQAMEQFGIEAKSVDIESTAFPIADGTADGVVLTEVIEHLWSNPLFTLTEINRILKSDTGVLILSTPNLSSLRNRFNFMWGKIDRVIENPFVSFLKKSRLGHFGHLRLYCPQELRALLYLCGFDATFHFKSVDYHHPVKNPWAPTLPAADVSTSNGEPQKPPLWKKLCRSPRAYGDALVATTRTCLENVHPPFRSHMFVLARKVRDANFDLNYPADLRALVVNNRI